MKRTLLLISSLLILSGCALFVPTADHTKYYRLSPSVAAANATFNAADPVLILQVLDVPFYLNDPRLAVSIGHEQWEFLEFDRWAGNMRKEIENICCQNLSQKLNKLVLPPVGQSGFAAPYTLSLRITEFYLDDQAAHLEGSWSLLDVQNRPLQNHTFCLQQAYEGPHTPQVIAQRMSHVLAELAKTLAAALPKLGTEVESLPVVNF